MLVYSPIGGIRYIPKLTHRVVCTVHVPPRMAYLVSVLTNGGLHLVLKLVQGGLRTYSPHPQGGGSVIQ